MDGSTPTNKLTLLACIQYAWDALTQAIAGRDLAAAGPNGWAIKDHLAHISEWERFVLRNQLQGRAAAEALQVPPETLEAFDIDRVNAMFFERNRRRPTADILADFHAIHAELLAALETAREDDLAQATRIFDDETNPVLVWVLYNTRDHYDEHLQAIRQPNA